MTRVLVSGNGSSFWSTDMITLGRIIHPSDPARIAELVQVFRAARKAHLQFLLDLHNEAEDREYFARVILPQNQVWAAEIAGRAAGFIAFAAGWVNHLYVAPQFHRRGVGTQLLNLAKESNPTLDLWVFEVNRPAIDFYARRGFDHVERTDGANNEARQPDVRMRWGQSSIGLPVTVSSARPHLRRRDSRTESLAIYR